MCKTLKVVPTTSLQNNPETAPLLIWLQGGPGAASMYGLFVEHGPFIITKDHRVLKRELAWTNDYHLLYIDQPAYTGFRYGLKKYSSLTPMDCYYNI